MRSVGKTLLALRQRRFDVAIDFQGNLRSGIVAFTSGARLRVGWSAGRVKEYCHVFYTRHIRSPDTPMHRAQRNLLLLSALGVAPRLLPTRLEVAPDEAPDVGEFFKKNNLEKKTLVALHPGVSRFGQFKQWNVEGFAQVARSLVRDRDCTVLVTWGPGEQELALRVVELAGAHALLGPRPAGLRELAYLLQRCALFVGCDTGPLHLAAAVGTTTVAIFGPKDPLIYGPLGDRHVIVRKKLDCSPCRRRACPDPRCMKSITAQEVYQACLGALG